MIAALSRLVLLLALLAAISGFQLLRRDAGTPVALAGGALLLCGLFAGKVAKELGLPRLTGYLLIGIVIGPHALRFIPAEGVAGLELVKGLAISLIALTAGAELHLSLLRRLGVKLLSLCAAICGVVFAISVAATLALRPLLPFTAEMSWPQTLAVAALMATMVVSFSPTVTIAVVQEERAQGSFTEFLMGLVIIGDLVVLVAFALAAGLCKAAFGGSFDLAGLAGGIGWELFGSIAVGGAIGLLLLLYMRRVAKELPIFIAATCFVSAEMGAHLHLSPLLVSLAAGAVIANLDPHQGERLNEAIQRAALTVFALFFAAAGAGLHLEVLVSVGLVCAVLVLVRAGAIWAATRKLAPREDPRLGRYLWMGLISQAGVTFGLAALVRRTFPSFGPAVEVLIVAMVTVGQLVGPVLTRRALQRSGEVMADAEPEKV